MMLRFVIVCTFFICLSMKNDSFNIEKAEDISEKAWSTVDSIFNRINEPIFPSTEYPVNTYLKKFANDFCKSVNAAIQECNSKGGGIVIVEKGNYICNGPIHLLSNVNLHLAEGSYIQFSDDPMYYTPLVLVRWEGTLCYNYSPLIYAYQQKNIAITGKGIIDGNGNGRWKEWNLWKTGKALQNPERTRIRTMGNDKIPIEQRVFGNGYLDLNGDGNDDGFGDGKPHYLRPTFIEPFECENILIEGITIKNSPFWTVHPVFSKNIICRNLTIRKGVTNDDGIDPDSSEDVLIDNCDIETHDDNISIKAGRDQDAWGRMGTKNIIIRNCKYLRTNCSGICIGSEMSGGVSSIFVENCNLQLAHDALYLKSNLDRGGTIQDVFVRNINVDSSYTLIKMHMDYHGYRGNNYPTLMKNVFMNSINCETTLEEAIHIVGVVASPIENVYLKDVLVKKAEKADTLNYTKNLLTRNVDINTK